MLSASHFKASVEYMPVFAENIDGLLHRKYIFMQLSGLYFIRL